MGAWVYLLHDTWASPLNKKPPPVVVSLGSFVRRPLLDGNPAKVAQLLKISHLMQPAESIHLSHVTHPDEEFRSASQSSGRDERGTGEGPGGRRFRLAGGCTAPTNPRERMSTLAVLELFAG